MKEETKVEGSVKMAHIIAADSGKGIVVLQDGTEIASSYSLQFDRPDGTGLFDHFTLIDPNGGQAAMSAIFLAQDFVFRTDKGYGFRAYLTDTYGKATFKEFLPPMNLERFLRREL